MIPENRLSQMRHQWKWWPVAEMFELDFKRNRYPSRKRSRKRGRKRRRKSVWRGDDMGINDQEVDLM